MRGLSTRAEQKPALVAAADQHHRHPVGEAAVGRSPDQRPRRSERRGEGRDKRQRSNRAGQGGVIGRLHAPERAALQSLRPRRRFSACFRASVRGFNRAPDHSHCIQPARRTWCRSVPTTEASSSWPRSPWFAAPRPGAPSWRAPRPTPLEVEPPRAAAGETGLPQRRRDARKVKSRHLLEPFAALKSAAAQRKAEALSAKLCHTGDDFVYEITLSPSGRAPRACRDGGRDGQNGSPPGA